MSTINKQINIDKYICFLPNCLDLFWYQIVTDLIFKFSQVRIFVTEIIYFKDEIWKIFQKNFLHFD